MFSCLVALFTGTILLYSVQANGHASRNIAINDTQPPAQPGVVTADPPGIDIISSGPAGAGISGSGGVNDNPTALTTGYQLTAPLMAIVVGGPGSARRSLDVRAREADGVNMSLASGNDGGERSGSLRHDRAAVESTGVTYLPPSVFWLVTSRLLIGVSFDLDYAGVVSDINPVFSNPLTGDAKTIAGEWCGDSAMEHTSITSYLCEGGFDRFSNTGHPKGEEDDKLPTINISLRWGTSP